MTANTDSVESVNRCLKEHKHRITREWTKVEDILDLNPKPKRQWRKPVNNTKEKGTLAGVSPQDTDQRRDTDNSPGSIPSQEVVDPAAGTGANDNVRNGESAQQTDTCRSTMHVEYPADIEKLLHELNLELFRDAVWDFKTKTASSSKKRKREEDEEDERIKPNPKRARHTGCWFPYKRKSQKREREEDEDDERIKPPAKRARHTDSWSKKRKRQEDKSDEEIKPPSKRARHNGF